MCYADTVVDGNDVLSVVEEEEQQEEQDQDQHYDASEGGDDDDEKMTPKGSHHLPIWLALSPLPNSPIF